MTTELTQPETCGSACETTKPEVFAKPQYTARETDGAYEVGVIMPGVGADRVDVNLEKDTLSITGRVKNDVPESWKVLHEEIANHDYRLVLELNFDYDDSGITAKVENGVLNLRLPIAEEAKPKSIEVS